LFSPANPVTNFSAAVNFALQASASSSTIYFYKVASSKSLSNFATFSVNNLTFSFTIARAFFFSSTVSTASAN
jgi:hypothetical protein